MANTTLDRWFYPWFGDSGGNPALLVSRAGSVRTRGYNHFRFRISRRLLEEQSGVKMEPGKIYELTGQIDGVCDFHTFRAGTSAETLFLHVPSDYQSLVVPHQLYQIRVNSVAQRQLSPEFADVVKRTRIGMNWSSLDRMLTPLTSNPSDPSKKCRGYTIVTWGPEGLAKIIRNTEPYIRTQNKRNQIARCKEELARPRRRLEEKVIRARLLLGIPPEGYA